MIDTALESWAPPTACDVTVGGMPSQLASAGNDEEADQLWDDSGPDWFLKRPDDMVHDHDIVTPDVVAGM